MMNMSSCTRSTFSTISQRTDSPGNHTRHAFRDRPCRSPQIERMRALVDGFACHLVQSAAEADDHWTEELIRDELEDWLQVDEPRNHWLHPQNPTLAEVHINVPESSHG